MIRQIFIIFTFRQEKKCGGSDYGFNGKSFFSEKVNIIDLFNVPECFFPPHTIEDFAGNDNKILATDILLYVVSSKLFVETVSKYPGNRESYEKTLPTPETTPDSKSFVSQTSKVGSDNSGLSC